jgi:Protein of unknown function (DUF2652)/Polyketide cyclase / dehydrase and lipid transport
MSPDVGEGYLVLADVSGYTGFLAGIELEHANGILSELIQEMLDGLTPPLELAAIEGDAVFAHAPPAVVARGETLLELFESTYVSFRRRRDLMQARTSCTCNACGRIGTLDLKFVAHYGPFAWQELAGRRSPVGHDVNLVHRLLKNGVEEETGWRGYALFTDRALERLGVTADGMHRRVEEYEHVGAITVAGFDLDERFQVLQAQPVEPPESHWSAALELPVPQAEVWQWLNDPVRRSRWIGERTVEAELLPEGRTGPGAVYHCHHGKDVIDHTIVDWRPFSGFSEEVRPRPGVRALLTWRLEPANGGTRLRLDVAMSAPLPGPVRRRLCRAFAEKELRTDLSQLEEAILA